MLDHEFAVEMEFGAASVLAAMIRAGRDRPRQIALEDVTRQTLKYRRLLMGVDLTSSGTLTGDSIIQCMLSKAAQPHG